MLYQEYLSLMHDILKPEAYLEIGINTGDSFALAKGLSIGIDPVFRLDKPVTVGKTVVKLFQCTSDEFFAKHDIRHELAECHLGLAFIDGLHLFEVALRDFINLEHHSDDTTVIMLHDTLPYDLEIAGRSPAPSNPAWAGDVWKIVEILERYRPDLYMQHVNVSPTGLLVVGNLSPTSQILHENYDQIVKEYLDRPLSAERMENLRKPGLLREPEESLRCPGFGAVVGRARIAQATGRVR